MIPHPWILLREQIMLKLHGRKFLKYAHTIPLAICLPKDIISIIVSSISVFNIFQSSEYILFSTEFNSSSASFSSNLSNLKLWFHKANMYMEVSWRTCNGWGCKFLASMIEDYPWGNIPPPRSVHVEHYGICTRSWTRYWDAIQLVSLFLSLEQVPELLL